MNKKETTQRWTKILIALVLVLFSGGGVPLSRNVEASGRGLEMIEFNGTSGLIDFGATQNNLLTGTISFLMYPDSLGENNLGRIAQKGDGSTVGWVIYVRNTGAADVITYAQFGYASDGSTNTYAWSAPITLGAWNLVTIFINLTSNPTEDDVTIYVNGADSSTGAGGGVLPIASDAAHSLYVGNRSDDSRTFDGMITDFRVYGFVATAADVLNIYNSRSMNVHPAAGLPVFRPVMYGASGLQSFDGTTLAAGNKLVDPYSGAIGTPAGSPTGIAETYVCAHAQREE